MIPSLDRSIWKPYLLPLRAGFCFASGSTPAAGGPRAYDVRAFGARGDGATPDTDAINRAIESAHAAGGGTVHFPAGTYLCFSIRLRSNIALYLDHGATLLAATPGTGGGAYDPAEPNEWDQYQDYGHSHWHNSLIWGENLANISIFGLGLIHGRGLTRRGPGPRRAQRAGDMPLSLGPDGVVIADPLLPGDPNQGEQHGRLGQQGDRPQILPQRPAARFFDPARRPLRAARHRRGQPHHRQRQGRHRSATASTSIAAATCASPTARSTRRTTTPSC